MLDLDLQRINVLLLLPPPAPIRKTCMYVLLFAFLFLKTPQGKITLSPKDHPLITLDPICYHTEVLVLSPPAVSIDTCLPHANCCGFGDS